MLFLFQGKDFGFDIGANEFDFLDYSGLFQILRVIASVKIELLPQMMFELKDLFFKFMVFRSHLVTSTPERLVLLRSDSGWSG